MADALHLDGKAYTVTPLLVEAGLPTFIRVSKMMGPGFAKLIGSAEFRQKDVSGPEFAELISDLFTRLDDPKLMETVTTLMDTVQENSVPLQGRWGMLFSGRLLSLSKILLYCVQCHFGDFLKGFNLQGSSSSKPEPTQDPRTKDAKKGIKNG